MNWTYEKLLNECLRLRQVADDAEAALMEFLYRVKTTPEMLGLVEDAGQSFDGFVQHDVLVRLSRYQRWEAGFVRLGSDTEAAMALGFDAVCAAVNVVSQDKVPAYVDANSAWRDEHKGLRPSIETAATLASQVDPQAKIPKAVKTRTIVQKLTAELAQEKAKVKELKAENRSLKKEIERLAKAGAKTQRKSGGSRKASGNSVKQKAA